LELVLANIACRAYNHRIGIFFILHPSSFILFMRPLRVFLCHASQDKPAVRKLHRYLKQRGVQPWLDELDLLPGENWEVEIPNAIFSSDVILVCLSKNSVDKEGYVQKEISFALDKALEKSEGTIFIVPVKLEDCDVPKRLNRFQWVDLFRPDGYKRLMLGLQKRASGLGADVSPVILDDTRRTPAQKTPKPEIKKPEEPISFSPREKGRDEGKPHEEPKQEIPVVRQEEKKPEVKFTQQKPYTKLLDPSSLSPNENPPVGRVSNPTKPVAPKERQAKSLTYGFWGIGLLVLILGGFGLNYLVKNIPVATATVFSPTKMVMPELPTFTSVTFTPTSQPTETPIPTPALGIGSTEISLKDNMTLLYVPAGEFTMGSDVNSDEQPIHQVTLPAFWIDQTEVTNAMFKKCVDDGECTSPSDTNHFSNSSYANHPVVYVDWKQANAYCSWVDRRLPTEAEWEKAARGTDGRTYPWGEGLDCDKANYYGCKYNTTTPVGSYGSGKSPYNAYDMAGNVLEWVNDYYQSDYYADNTSNPQGPLSGDSRVLRGGSWLNFGSDVRSAYRGRIDPALSFNFSGFRCACSP
jgi:formylglycine-generating enzyme required for sulfatase activity